MNAKLATCSDGFTSTDLDIRPQVTAGRHTSSRIQKEPRVVQLARRWGIMLTFLLCGSWPCAGQDCNWQFQTAQSASACVGGLISLAYQRSCQFDCSGALSYSNIEWKVYSAIKQPSLLEDWTYDTVSQTFTNRSPNSGYCSIATPNSEGNSASLGFMGDGTGTPDTITVEVTGEWECNPTDWVNLGTITFTISATNGSGCSTCSSRNSAANLSSGVMANDQGPDVRFGLGPGAYGQTAGILMLKAAETTNSLASPSALSLPIPPTGTNVNYAVIYTNGAVRQINAPQGLVNVQTITNGYALQMFYIHSVLSNAA